jgi:hypothetical protein
MISQLCNHSLAYLSNIFRYFRAPTMLAHISDPLFACVLWQGHFFKQPFASSRMGAAHTSLKRHQGAKLVGLRVLEQGEVPMPDVPNIYMADLRSRDDVIVRDNRVQKFTPWPFI